MRLDKYISQVTDLSRKDVKRLLRADLVTVNGATVRDASLHVTADAVVCLEGETLNPPRPRYLMLHKPAGYVCATKSRQHPSVLELIDEPNLERLQIVGRLDVDSTGLLLLTDDGSWNHAITSPRRECAKTYLVTLAEDIGDEAVARFREGILLEGEATPTRPAQLEILFSNEARVTISEGRYHQVKRMFAALGNRVVELHRTRVGAIILDDDLTCGDYRALSASEIASVH